MASPSQKKRKKKTMVGRTIGFTLTNATLMGTPPNFSQTPALLRFDVDIILKADNNHSRAANYFSTSPEAIIARIMNWASGA